ncbi:MAG: FMN-binding protein [Treponemataceae bacterium]
MKKAIIQSLKLGAILACFAGAACVLLALVNNVTAPKIKALSEQARNDALRSIFSEAAEFSVADGFEKETIDGIDIEEIYIAKDAKGKIIGAAVQASGATYDRATILSGITTENNIKAIKILSISDTSGFGQNALKPDFAPQFTGKSLDDPFSAEKGGDIDGLSGATITRRGIAKILKISTTKAQSQLKIANGNE